MIPMLFEILLDKREVDCMPFLELWSSQALSNHTQQFSAGTSRKKKKREIWSTGYAENVSGHLLELKESQNVLPSNCLL